MNFCYFCILLHRIARLFTSAFQTPCSSQWLGLICWTVVHGFTLDRHRVTQLRLNTVYIQLVQFTWTYPKLLICIDWFIMTLYRIPYALGDILSISFSYLIPLCSCQNELAYLSINCRNGNQLYSVWLRILSFKLYGNRRTALWEQGRKWRSYAQPKPIIPT